MVSKEIGSVSGLLALYREESYKSEELSKDLETFNKEKLIEYILSDLSTDNGDEADDY